MYHPGDFSSDDTYVFPDAIPPHLVLAQELRERAARLEQIDAVRWSTRIERLRERARQLESREVDYFPLRGQFTVEDVVQSFGFSDPVLAVALSPDSSRIAIAGKAGEVRVIALDKADDEDRNPCLMKFQTGDSVVSLSFSQDSQYVVVGGFDGIVRVISVEQQDSFGRPLVVISFAPGACATTVRFSADGRYLAIASGWVGAGNVKVARIDSLGASPPELLLDEWTGGSTPAVEFHPDCEHVAISGNRTQILCLEERSEHGAGLRPVLTMPDTARTLAFSPDGKFLALGGGIRIAEGSALRLHLLSKSGNEWQQEQVSRFRAHRYIRAVAFSPRGALIAVGLESPLVARPNEIVLFGVSSMLSEGYVTTKSEIARCDTDRPVRALSFSNDGRMIAVGGDHAIVWLFGLTHRNKPRYSPDAASEDEPTNDGDSSESSDDEGDANDGLVQ